MSLYIVGTPIGNLKDITLRALEILKEVDFIICEDTRVTSKLLARYEIKKPLVSYFQHSKARKTDEIIHRLEKGESAALVTDAGTPGISDPGGKLVELILEENIDVVPIPGVSAVTAILSISGMSSDKFIFLGFPPHKKGRQKFFKQLIEETRTVVFYESCHRIKKALDELSEHVNKDCKFVIGRELTKMHESVYRGTIDEVIEQVGNDPQKGEYVVVLQN